MRRHNGFALPVALFAIMILGVIATAGFYSSRQETQIGNAYEKSAMAFYLAERGLAATMTSWDPDNYNTMAQWQTTTVSDTTSMGITDVRIMKGGDKLFYLDATSTVTLGGVMQGGASRRVGVIARIAEADIDPRAALTTRNSANIGGTAEVHGEDATPLYWGGYCDPSTYVDKPGILIDDTTGIGTKGQGTVTGNPPWVGDSTLTDEAFTLFGDYRWDDLVALADKSLSGGNFNTMQPYLHPDGTCNKGHRDNWGDPENVGTPCSNYFPIVHVNGSARIQSGGVGQGILLVEKDLDVRGNFHFYGVILVKGNFETQGNGNKVYGAVQASNAQFDNQTLIGNSVVQWSSCSLDRVINNIEGLNRARPIHERSWIDLSTVLN